MILISLAFAAPVVGEVFPEWEALDQEREPVVTRFRVIEAIRSADW